MNKAFEKILERLEELQNNLLSQTEGDAKLQVGIINGVMYSRKIVKEVAEKYNGGWIPCNERLPEENQVVILQDFYGNITIEKMKINDGLEGFTDGDWWSSANNYVAWLPLPKPYKESD